MRSPTRVLAAAMLAAAPLLGLVVPSPAGAAPANVPGAVATKAEYSAQAAGWVYWASYRDAASCLYFGRTLAYPGSPIYAAYYCEEEYRSVGNYFEYELFLYKKF